MAGTYPRRRHDLEDWRESDGQRTNLAGEPLGYQALCLYIKADWGELSGSFGFPTWQDKLAPCPLCFAEKDSFWEHSGLTPFDSPHRPKTLTSYCGSCTSCEHVRDLSADEVRTVSVRTLYDKTEHGSRGRAFHSDVPSLRLQKGDRVEPSLGNENVAAVD